MLVVGGGITGAGVALDAASRGLRTALVERDDFASGTSSKSSKLVHGGLRYLQQREFGLVYEGLAERQRRAATTPLTSSGSCPSSSRCSPRTGDRPPPGPGPGRRPLDVRPHRRVAHRQAPPTRLDRTRRWRTCRRWPADRVAGGYLYYDAHADDARLTLTHRADRGRPRRGRRELRRASRRSARTATARVVGARVAGRRATRSCAGGSSSTPPASGPTTCERSTRAPSRVDPARQGHPHHRAVDARYATTSPSIVPVAKRPAVGVRRAVGRHRRTSAPPTPTTTDRSTIPRAPPTTSTTCSAPSTA